MGTEIHAEPGGSTLSPGMGARIRAAWELSQPRAFGTLLTEQPEPAPNGWAERLQESTAAIFYFCTFAAIVIAVFFRFVLNRPVVWSIELPTYFFFWCFCIATSLSDWDDDQISFDLVADRMPQRLRLAASALGNIVIVIPFLIVLPGTIDYLRFQSSQPSSALPFSQAWGYAAILPFFGLGILLRGRLLLRQLRELYRSIHGPPQGGR
jgi:TRAP-type C4-dicarboxylate transport system permease small subunit